MVAAAVDGIRVVNHPSARSRMTFSLARGTGGSNPLSSSADDLALSYGFDPALKPTKLDISETVRWLGYKPSYSLASLLSELAAYGDPGPPRLIRA